MENPKTATQKDLNKKNIGCWGGSCKKTGWIDMYGWQYCVKHWREDYKYGCEVGFKIAIKCSKFQLIKLIKNIIK